MRESQIESYLRDQIKGVGGWAPKWVSPGNNGVPDRIIFLPDRKIVFIETKAPGKKPTPLQIVQHRRLASFGWDVPIIDSREQVDAWIREL